MNLPKRAHAHAHAHDDSTPLPTTAEGGVDLDALAADIRAMQPAPFVPDIDDMWDMSVDELHRVFARVSRNGGPALLSELVDAGVVEDETIAALVGDVWSAAEYPEAAAAYEEWAGWFRTAGEGRLVHDDGTPIPAPTEVPVLYRGGKLRDRMSWTSDREVAVKFARGLSFRPTDGTVWAIRDLPPALVLARVDGRNEHEWVVDIAGYVGEPEVVLDLSD